MTFATFTLRSDGSEFIDGGRGSTRFLLAMVSVSPAQKAAHGAFGPYNNSGNVAQDAHSKTARDYRLG